MRVRLYFPCLRRARRDSKLQKPTDGWIDRGGNVATSMACAGGDGSVVGPRFYFRLRVWVGMGAFGLVWFG